MDKKTLLAIVLSIAVLFSYEAMFVGPKRAQMAKESQATVNKEVASISAPATTAPSEIAKKSSQTTNVNFKEEKWAISSTEFNSNITNVGGALQNLKIGINHVSPVVEMVTLASTGSNEYKAVSSSKEEAVVSYTGKDIKVTKQIKVIDANTISVRMEINSALISSLDNTSIVLLGLDSSTIDPNNKREVMLDEYSVYVDGKVIRKGNADKFEAKENKIKEGKVGWVGFREHFTSIIVKPEFETKSYAVQVVTDKHLQISVVPAKVNMVGGVAVYEFTIYAGPQDAFLMKKYGKDFDKHFVFSNYWPLEIIGKGIYYTIGFLQGIVKSWGFTIILISVLIYGITYPLTFKSMMSMRRMQLMQPKIKALQERYKGDPQKLNAEIMDVYKREKINPLGGCLPFLLQMPIFVALYQVLWRSYYFQGKSFLWIKDLAQPDRTFILPFSLPFLGNELNILPILMAIVMFLQQKISAKSMVVTDEQQVMQQKMMMYFFPVFIGFIFYKFASGLSLYFTVFYLLSTLTQLKMSKIK